MKTDNSLVQNSCNLKNMAGLVALGKKFGNPLVEKLLKIQSDEDGTHEIGFADSTNDYYWNNITAQQLTKICEKHQHNLVEHNERRNSGKASNSGDEYYLKRAANAQELLNLFIKDREALIARMTSRCKDDWKFSRYDMNFIRDYHGQAIFNQTYATIILHMLKNGLKDGVVDIGCSLGLQSELFKMAGYAYTGVEQKNDSADAIGFFNASCPDINYLKATFPNADIDKIIKGKTGIACMSLGFKEYEKEIPDFNRQEAYDAYCESLAKTNSFYIRTEQPLAKFVQERFKKNCTKINFSKEDIYSSSYDDCELMHVSP